MIAAPVTNQQMQAEVEKHFTDMHKEVNRKKSLQEKLVFLRESEKRAHAKNKEIHLRNVRRRELAAQKNEECVDEPLLFGKSYKNGKKLIQRYFNVLRDAFMGGVIGQNGDEYVGAEECLDPRVDLATTRRTHTGWSRKLIALDRKLSSGGRGFLLAILNKLPELYPEVRNLSWANILDDQRPADADEKHFVSQMISDADVEDAAAVVPPKLVRQNAFAPHIEAGSEMNDELLPPLQPVSLTQWHPWKATARDVLPAQPPVVTPSQVALTEELSEMDDAALDQFLDDLINDDYFLSAPTPA